MSGIVCAIRGGTASQPTIELAIQSALKYDLPIYFLYIVDLDFLSSTNSARLHTITEEMEEMGEFILLATQAKANARGVEAYGFVRKGGVSDEIIALSHEKEANYVVLGKPKEKKKNVFTQDLLNVFAGKIAAKTGAKVLFAETGA